MGKKGLSTFNEEAQSTHSNKVEVMQIQNEINESEEKESKVEEHDHTSWEEQNAEEITELFSEYRKEKNEQDESVVDADADTDEEPDNDSPESKEDTQTETEPKKEKADDALPVIPEVLRRTALQLGVTPEEMQEIKSVGDLSQIIETLKAIQPTKVEEEQESEEEDPLDKIKLDPDEYEESLVSAFDGLKDMVRTLRDENKNLKSTHESREKAIQEQIAFEQYEQKIKEFDNTVEQLSNVKLFGKGDALTLKPEEDAFKNRSKLFDEVDILGNSYYKAGKEVPAMEELIKMAGVRLFGDKFNKNEEISKKLEERSQNFLGKPSPRESMDETDVDDGSKESRLKKSISAVGEFLEKRGLKK